MKKSILCEDPSKLMMEMSVLWTLSLVYDQTFIFPLSMQFKSRLRREHNSCLSPRVKRFRWEQHRLCGQTAAVASLCTQPVYTVDAQQRHTLWHCKQYYMEYTANVMDAWTWWKVDRYFRRMTLLIDDIYRNHKINVSCELKTYVIGLNIQLCEKYYLQRVTRK